MPNFTPGSWGIKSKKLTDIDNHFDYVIHKDGIPLAIVWGKILDPQLKKYKYSGETNAHLIAAAPDMYEALKDLVQWREAVMHNTGQLLGRARVEMLWQKAMNALAKAEGRETNARD